MMNDPEVWPVCPEHKVPYVLRRGLSLTSGARWVWVHDCTTSSGTRRRACGQLQPVLHDTNGPVEAS